MPSFRHFYTWYGQRHMIPIIQAQGLHCTIIDDAHPEPLGKVEGCDVYRIDVHVAWNIPGAKNLGFHVLDGWILCLPIDHVLTPEVHAQIDAMPKQRGEAYFFASISPDGEVEPAHLNPHDMVLIHKADFDAIGGYDEDFAGNYGYEDTLFWQMCCNSLRAVERFDIRVLWFPSGMSDGGSRDSSHNRAILEDKNKFGMLTPKLRFTYHKE